VTILFRGREVTHPEFGRRLLQRMADIVNEVASMERQPLMEGRRMNIILSLVASQKTKITEGIKDSQHAKD